ncbi:MAG: glycerol-3-phosphate acyltransferase [Puniceicoccales bacterium]|jgi:glycerol-3-phosphate acyltransferase PlsY|nr:glycerol-3-phosphate acyltransferase [Puniceicoccales bacterium]
MPLDVPTIAALFAAAYLVGNVSPGLLLARFFGKGDLRAQGSGATGATNAARALGGKKWFFAILALDIAKAAFAVLFPPLCLAAEHFPVASVLCGLGVVAGHIWPALLGFRGGKGIGPFLGVWLAIGFFPWLAGECGLDSTAAFWPRSLLIAPTLLAPIAVGLFFLPLKKGAFMAALCGLWAQPLAFYFLTEDIAAALLAEVIVVCILTAHRNNFNKAFGKNTDCNA